MVHEVFRFYGFQDSGQHRPSIIFEAVEKATNHFTNGQCATTIEPETPKTSRTFVKTNFIAKGCTEVAKVVDGHWSLGILLNNGYLRAFLAKGN